MIFIIHKVFNNNKLKSSIFLKLAYTNHSNKRGRAAKGLGLKWTLGAELSGLPYYPAPLISNNVLQKSSAQNGLSQEKPVCPNQNIWKRGDLCQKTSRALSALF